MPPKTRKTTPTVRAVPVTHKNRTVDVLYHPDWPTSRLLAEAVRAHGLKFATSPDLRLYRTDGVSPLPRDHHSVAVVGIANGDPLTLRPAGA